MEHGLARAAAILLAGLVFALVWLILSLKRKRRTRHD